MTYLMIGAVILISATFKAMAEERRKVRQARELGAFFVANGITTTPGGKNLSWGVSPSSAGLALSVKVRINQARSQLKVVSAAGGNDKLDGGEEQRCRQSMQPCWSLRTARISMV